MNLESFLLAVAIICGFVVVFMCGMAIYMLRLFLIDSAEADERFKIKEQEFNKRHQRIESRIEAGRKSMFGS